MEKTKEFRLTGIPPEVHRVFKIFCARWQMSMNKVLLDYMTQIAMDSKQFIEPEKKGGKYNE